MAYWYIAYSWKYSTSETWTRSSRFSKVPPMLWLADFYACNKPNQRCGVCEAHIDFVMEITEYEYGLLAGDFDEDGSEIADYEDIQVRLNRGATHT